MTALITGGCGFIGSHLAAALLRDGVPVRVIDDLSTGKRSNLPQGAELIEADIVDEQTFRTALEGVDRVFHLAAIASVERSRTDWLRTHQVNITGMVNLLHHIAISGRKIPVVYASSAAIYGNAAKPPIAETAPTRPASAYGVDKLACEMHARVGWELHGIPSAGLRFFNVYGPGQDPHSPYSGVISIFMERAAKAQGLTIYGNGQQTRDFVFVEDVVRSLCAAMQKLRDGDFACELFNIGTGTSVTIKALAEMVRDIAGKEFAIHHGPARQGEVQHSFCDNRHAGKLLGVLPTCPLQHGLTLTYDAHCHENR